MVYVDEIWFTTRISHSKEWLDTYSRQVPPGEGERFVMVAAATSKGYIGDSFLCYTSRNSTGDYHGEKNVQLFHRWLTTKLLPSLSEPLVIVIDNAPYRSQLTEVGHSPNTATRKDDLMRWLEQHNIPIPYPPYASGQHYLCVGSRGCAGTTSTSRAKR